MFSVSIYQFGQWIKPSDLRFRDFFWIKKVLSNWSEEAFTEGEVRQILQDLYMDQLARVCFYYLFF